jgi:hypothetical protein
MEIWKDIPELQGKYQCSNYGSIRRKNKDHRCQEYKLLNNQLTKDGYLSSNPTRNYRKRLHRIVAELFIDNPNNKPYVNHKDLNKLNNHFSNLEWVTASENSQHANNNGKLGRMHCSVIDINNKQIYKSIKQACEFYSFPYKYAAKILKTKGVYKNLKSIEKTYKNIF